MPPSRDTPLPNTSLGRLLFNGEGVVERDLIRGTHWIRRAAEQGLPEALFNYALLFRNGTGVPQDLGEAHFWCLLAERDADDELRELLVSSCAEIALRLTPGERFEAESRTWQWTPLQENPSVWPHDQ